MIKYEVIVDENGSKEWWLNGKRHREDGPAVEYEDGSKHWYINGKLHRENGPAVEDIDGPQEWWFNGKLHRENGPAVEYPGRLKEWWVNGVKISKKEFNSRIKSTCKDKIVEIDGVKYKLVKI